MKTDQEIIETLDKLVALQNLVKANVSLLQMEKEDLITPEIRAGWEALEAKRRPEITAFEEEAARVEAEVKQAVIDAGKTVKGSVLMAVYAKGRTSWDSKGLDGFAVAHPEIKAFRSEGDASVSIRRIK